MRLRMCVCAFACVSQCYTHTLRLSVAPSAHRGARSQMKHTHTQTHTTDSMHACMHAFTCIHTCIHTHIHPYTANLLLAHIARLSINVLLFQSQHLQKRNAQKSQKMIYIHIPSANGEKGLVFEYVYLRYTFGVLLLRSLERCLQLLHLHTYTHTHAPIHTHTHTHTHT
jgi:hypothetical protein